MEQMPDPMLKQYITSMAFGNNVLKQTPEGICLLKNELSINHQSPKTLSLFLTRLPHVVSSYVHVLKCNICDYLTLNTVSLKEHTRLKHPSSPGFWTYSCFSCSSMSTEKSLMEEHLKIYHRITDSPTEKLIEKFHGSGVSESATSTTMTLTSVPCSVNSVLSHVNQTSSPNNLSSLIKVSSVVREGQKCLEEEEEANSSCKHMITSTPQSVEANLKMPDHNTQTNHIDVSEDISENPLGAVSTVAADVRSSTATSVSGSRRRKATVPGRICPRSMTTGEDQSDPDGLRAKSDESGLDTSLSDSDQSGPGRLRTFEPQDANSSDQPPAKKSCVHDQRNTDLAPDLTLRNKQQSPHTTGIPFLLSITPTPEPSSKGNTVTTPASTNSGLVGQLIPISGLPEQLFCGITSQPNHNQSISLSGSSGQTFAVPVMDSQPGVSGSAWLLTNQPNQLTTPLTSTPGAMTAFHPTILVPVPSSAPEPQVNKPVSDSPPAIDHPSNMVRLSDLLEILRNLTTMPSTSLSAPSQTLLSCDPRATSSPQFEPLAARSTNATEPCSASVVTSAQSNFEPYSVSSASGQFAHTNQNLLNHLILAAIANTTAESGSLAESQPGNDEDQSKRTHPIGSGHEQALDMSVRSGNCIGAQVCYPSENEAITAMNTTSAPNFSPKQHDYVEGKSVYTIPTKHEFSNAATIQGVVEVLNTALRGNTKQQQQHGQLSSTETIDATLLQYLNQTANRTNQDQSITQDGLEFPPRSVSDANGKDKTAAVSESLSNLVSTETGYSRPATSSTDSPRTVTSTPTSIPQLVSLSQLQALMAAMATHGSISLSGRLTPHTLGTTRIQSTCASAATSGIAAVPLTAFTNTHLTPTTQYFLTPSGLVPSQTNSQDQGATLLVPTSDNGSMFVGISNTGSAMGPSGSTSNLQGANNNTSKHTLINQTTDNFPSSQSVPGSVPTSQLGHLSCSTMGSPTLINLVATSNRPMTSTQTSFTLNSTAATRLLTNLTGFPANLPNSNAFLQGLGIATNPTSAITTGANVLNLFDSSLFATSSGTQLTVTTNSRNQAMVNGPKPSLSVTSPLIGVLDPRTSIHLRLADQNMSAPVSCSSATLLNSTTGDLSQCLLDTSRHSVGNVTGSVPMLKDDFVSLRLGESKLNTTTATTTITTTTGSSSSTTLDARRKGMEADMEYTSSIESHHEDDWDGDGIARSSMQTVHPGCLKLEAREASGGSSPSVSSALLAPAPRRTAGSSRSSALGGNTTSRRSMGSLNADGSQAGRPHRQNFTPTQNRILTEWYQTHQAKPYPSTDDTKELANISGLSYSQVKKWFANKRARSSSSGLPKPTPPLAPDSVSDATTAAAMVAAAMAAAATTGAVPIDAIDENPLYLFQSGGHHHPLASSPVADLSTSTAAPSVKDEFRSPTTASDDGRAVEEDALDDGVRERTQPAECDFSGKPAEQSSVLSSLADTIDTTHDGAAASPPTMQVLISPRAVLADAKDGSGRADPTEQKPAGTYHGDLGMSVSSAEGGHPEL